jgi:hypothetical protein
MGTDGNDGDASSERGDTADWPTLFVRLSLVRQVGGVDSTLTKTLLLLAGVPKDTLRA